jgi:hypothetical protein
MLCAIPVVEAVHVLGMVRSLNQSVVGTPVLAHRRAAPPEAGGIDPTVPRKRGPH